MSEITSSQIVNHSNNVTGGGVDYDSGPYTVRFTAGVIRTTFNVPINDDNILEDDEMFNLDVDSSTLPTGFTVGAISNSSVTIEKDDCKFCCCFIIATVLCIVNKR